MAIEINLERVCDRASLVYCLRQLHTQAGGLSYRELSARTGGRLARATIGELIGEKSPASTRPTTWPTVELFIEACDVPLFGRDAWHEAWERSVAPDPPAWMAEQDQIKAEVGRLESEVGQLKAQVERSDAALKQALARAQAAEAKLERATTEKAVQSVIVPPDSPPRTTQPVVLRPVPEPPGRGNGSIPPSGSAIPIEHLRIRADTFLEARDYEQAAELYRQLAQRLEHQFGPGDTRSLQAWQTHLDALSRSLMEEPLLSKYVAGSDPYAQREEARKNANTQWLQLIDHYRRWLSEGHRMVLSLRLLYVGNWARTLVPPKERLHDPSALMVALYADCKIFLPANDPLTQEVARYVKMQQEAREKIRQVKK